MALNFEITIYKLFYRFHHRHILKYFVKTDGLIHKTAMSNKCYYLFSFYQWNTGVLNDLPRSHTENLV